MSLENNFICILIKDDALSAIEFENGWNGLHLKNYAYKQLTEGLIKKGYIQNSEALSKEIHELLQSGQPEAIGPKEVIVIINDDLVFHHNFILENNLTEEEITQLLPNKAESVIPFKKDEIAWDYTIGKNSDLEQQGKIKVQFSAIAKDMYHKYFEIFQNIGMRIMSITSEIEVYKEFFKVAKETTNILLIEMNRTQTQFAIFENNILEKSTIIEAGLVANTDSQAAIEKIALTSNMLITEKKCNAVIIWGESVFQDGFLNEMKKRLPPTIKISTLWNEKKSETFSKYPVINNNLVSFGIVIAAANNLVNGVDGKRMHNLLPFAARPVIGSKKSIQILNRSGIVIIGLSIGLAFIMSFFMLSFKFELNTIKKETENFESLIYGEKYYQIKNDIIDLNKDIEAFYNLSIKIEKLPKIYEDIITLNNPDISFSSITYYREQKLIGLNGTAKSRQSLLTFQEQLKMINQNGSIESPLSNFNLSTDIPFEIKIIFNGK